MLTIFYILTFISALLCGYIFLLESFLWETPKAQEIFQIKNSTEVENTKFLAFNQGFYNLFLGVGMLLGVIIHTEAAKMVAVFCLACMLLAAIILALKDRKFVKTACMQGALPLIALIFYVISA